MKQTSFKLVGSQRGRVDLDMGEVSISQPSLKAGLSFGVDRLAAVVRQTELVTDPTIYQRRVRTLRLSPRDANVLLVFSEPLFVSGFAYGAEQSLAITRRDRKNGLAVDVVGLTVDEPDRFVADLVGQGIRSATLAESLGATVGVATAVDRERRVGEERITLRKFRARLLLFALASAILLAVRLGLIPSANDTIRWSEVVWRLVVTAAAFPVSAMIARALTRDPSRPRPVRDQGSVRLRLGALLPAVVYIGIIWWTHVGHHVHGSGLIVLDGVLAGTPTGAFAGYIWKRMQPTSTTDSSPFLA